jgi:transposase-like protein
MTTLVPPTIPPFCPHRTCVFHTGDTTSWRFVRIGSFVSGRLRLSSQRYKCLRCRRTFSNRTFRASYWLKRPDLLVPIARRLVSCSGFRQIARELGVSPQTVARHASRLGRQAMLFHVEIARGKEIKEPVALDTFVSFEYSQFFPTGYHILVGRNSHFCYGFTDSEYRRSGTMTPWQKKRRAELEARLGQPDSRSTEKEVAALLGLATEWTASLNLTTDEHPAYPLAIRRVSKLPIEHHMISSRAVRTPRNPLFAINLTDGLIRHSSANHKRETIAYSKRRLSAIDRLWHFFVWRSLVKSFSEKTRGETPALKAGITDRRWTLKQIYRWRLFPLRVRLPGRWQKYYDRAVVTRAYGAREIRSLVHAY